MQAGRQRNLRLHLWAASLVGVVGSALQLTATQAIASLLCVLMVLFAELVNTALESLVDLHTERFHALAGRAKDTAAAAVLLLAAGAVLIFGAVCVDAWRHAPDLLSRALPVLVIGSAAPLSIGLLLAVRTLPRWSHHLLWIGGLAGVAPTVAVSQTLLFPGLSVAVLCVSWRLAAHLGADTHLGADARRTTDTHASHRHNEEHRHGRPSEPRAATGP